jgi:hypothetical protein
MSGSITNVATGPSMPTTTPSKSNGILRQCPHYPSKVLHNEAFATGGSDHVFSPRFRFPRLNTAYSV